MPRRSQAERTDETTSALVRAAQRLFGEKGYSGSSLDEVAAAAGVTKGAAYHHFRGKPDLLRAVFIAEQRQTVARLEHIAAEAPDPLSALRSGFRAFLQRCLEPGFRRIVLLDGPAVLGWDVVREIESEHVLRILTAGMHLAAQSEPDTGRDLEVRCRMAFGALCEAGMLLARSPDAEARLPAVLAETERLLGPPAG
jgi:AcrR family transcriptional regulator